MARILAIDDDENFLISLKNLLAFKRHEVTILTNPFRTEKYLKKPKFDCVLLDLKMPGLNGFSLLKKIHRFCPTLPVIIISGLSSEDAEAKVLKEGAFEFIEKPFDGMHLLEVIERALQKSRQNYPD
ncbi:MAG: response regulator [Calditrichaeota bacterium]|nr:response regulator [Calditrichota bacterium]